jgi:hypothetical protein
VVLVLGELTTVQLPAAAGASGKLVAASFVLPLNWPACLPAKTDSPGDLLAEVVIPLNGVAATLSIAMSAPTEKTAKPTTTRALKMPD